MTDLLRLASWHRTEVISGGIERICQFPDENKVTRCLFTMCEKSCNGETLWIQLIDVFEKYLQVHSKKRWFKERNLANWNSIDDK